jgi:mono/diheme cytochrome c family protein
VRSKFLLTAAFASAALAQQRTVLDGAFTAAQSERGKSEYTRYCSGCHGTQLDGGGSAPQLHNAPFLNNWREDYVSSLYQQIHDRMPPSRAAQSIKDEQYVDIVAYILSMNGFPAGQSELTRPTLETTFLVGLDGPKPMPPSATVRVVGCIVQQGSDWALTQATRPTRVRDGTETDASELDRSKQARPGTNSYRLTNLDEDHSAAELKTFPGKKAQVKGVLNVAGGGPRIYVLNFALFGQDCAQ